MSALYPEIRPFARHELAVDAIHTLYVEEIGNPEGIPAVFLHGGPGAGCEPYHRRFFDPDRYRVVLFDQRGCGRSRPHASLQNNTTWHLVDDIERIRQYLGIDSWLVFGGSWGSTLGLAYAETYPDRVTAMVLRGIFLCRPQEIHWFYQQGASRLYPDYWQDFIAPVAPEKRGDLLSAYHRLLTGDDELRRMAAARAWAVWEGRCATLLSDSDVVAHFRDPHVALSMARIECDYFMHDAYLRPNQLLAEAHRLEGVPGVIVHGRYDTICPVENAWALHQAWPGSELAIQPASGHSAGEPEIAEALVRATDYFAEELVV